MPKQIKIMLASTQNDKFKNENKEKNNIHRERKPQNYLDRKNKGPMV